MPLTKHIAFWKEMVISMFHIRWKWEVYYNTSVKKYKIIFIYFIIFKIIYYIQQGFLFIALFVWLVDLYFVSFVDSLLIASNNNKFFKIKSRNHSKVIFNVWNQFFLSSIFMSKFFSQICSLWKIILWQC